MNDCENFIQEDIEDIASVQCLNCGHRWSTKEPDLIFKQHKIVKRYRDLECPNCHASLRLCTGGLTKQKYCCAAKRSNPMKEYHKILTVFERNPDTKFRTLIEGRFACPEFEYLRNCNWTFTEKVDGTCIRVMWQDGKIIFGGKKDKSQIPVHLVTRLQEVFLTERFMEPYPDKNICLYGEGYGAKIQKGGGNYNPDGVDFVLFDVHIDDVWLERDNVVDIANKLEIQTVPVIGFGPLLDAVRQVKDGFSSQWGDFPAEGLVMRPAIEILSRNGDRVIAKIKSKDFRS